jgi:hypothetical protein
LADSSGASVPPPIAAAQRGAQFAASTAKTPPVGAEKYATPSAKAGVPTPAVPATAPVAAS